MCALSNGGTPPQGSSLSARSTQLSRRGVDFLANGNTCVSLLVVRPDRGPILESPKGAFRRIHAHAPTCRFGFRTGVFSTSNNARTRPRVNPIGSAEDSLREQYSCHDKAALVENLGRGKLVAFVEAARYDEATSTVGVEQPRDVPLPRSAEGNVLALRDQVLSEFDSVKETAPAKIFQTESVWGALLVVRNEDTHEAEYLYLTSNGVTSAQVLQRTTAECFAGALRLSSLCRAEAVRDAKFKMRFICSDRLSAQWAAERALASLRHGWQKVHLGCEVHMSVGASAKGLLRMDDAVSGMIHFALSLKLGGWMTTFRSCLCEEVSETLDIQLGVPPPGTQAYRNMALTVFMGVGARKRLIQSIMTMLPN